MRTRLWLRSEDGSVSLWAVVIGSAMMLMLAMIVDSQQIRSGRRQAGDIAFEAARAGAQALDRDEIPLGKWVIDEGLARQTVEGYVGTEATAVVRFVGDEIEVTVTVPVDLHFGFVQGDSTTVSSTRRAQIFQG